MTTGQELLRELVRKCKHDEFDNVLLTLKNHFNTILRSWSFDVDDMYCSKLHVDGVIHIVSCLHWSYPYKLMFLIGSFALLLAFKECSSGVGTPKFGEIEGEAIVFSQKPAI